MQYKNNTTAGKAQEAQSQLSEGEKTINQIRETFGLEAIEDGDELLQLVTKEKYDNKI